VADFVIKAAISDPDADTFILPNQKTMYGGKGVEVGDRVFVFASESDEGNGLIAEGEIASVKATPKKSGVPRQTPRVSVAIRVLRRAKTTLGRDQLKRFSDWSDGKPETELNFKFYRQATNKLCGITHETARFLDKFF